MSENYLVPGISGEMYLYGRQDNGATFGFVISLTMTLRGDFLRRALDDVTARFPQMAVGVVRDGEKLSFARLDREVPLYEGRNFSFERVAGSNDAGGYLFSIAYDYKTLFFDFHRALCDEKGALIFIKALIYRYIQISDLPVLNDGSIKTVAESYSDAEGCDSLSRLDDLQASRPVWYMDARALRLPETGKGSYCVTQIRIPLGKLKGEAAAFKSSPVTYIAPVFSHSIYEMYGKEMPAGEFIVASIKASLRPYFPTASVRSFFTPVFLAYNRKITDYPLTTVLMSQKKLLEAQLRPDALAYSAQRCLKDMRSVCDGRLSFDEKKDMARAVFGKSASMSTYEICNIGNVIMPESLMQYVTEFYSVLSPAAHTCALSLASFKSEFSVTVSHADKSGALCRRFVELLNDNDIYSYISDDFDYLPMKYEP